MIGKYTSFLIYFIKYIFIWVPIGYGFINGEIHHALIFISRLLKGPFLYV